MNITAIIPARMGASRLPGKPLADIGGLPMVVHTWRAAAHHPDLDDAVVATDHPDIAAAVQHAGGRATLTGEHPSGTDRCAEASRLLGLTGPNHAILNLQGDEPFPEADHLSTVCAALRAGQADIVTAMRPALDEEAGQPERVKVAAGADGRALFFSRSAIPHSGPHHIHLGIYAFAPDVLARCAALPVSRLERLERLEQLRWLEAGMHLHVTEVAAAHGPGSVDTEADLERMRAWWKANRAV
ncbi:MAG: 3-deoxy-manno-octulosonate cytidylyltransferase [Crocinitomicaceae bacterium TMED114]|nr:MAG: 3-deoxy-manno-octulosonate cytidylyltransferase [Crocinitomicaceae bacterium TMED114]